MANLTGTVCYILRHVPEDFGLELDEYGYVDTKELVLKLSTMKGKRGFPDLTIEDIVEMVAEDDKGRYRFKNGVSLLKCNFGHSLDVKSEIEQTESIPDVLYHGTAKRFLDSILQEGLKSGQRKQVHITSDIHVAKNVGNRYAKSGKLIVILEVDTKQMIADGLDVYSTGTSTYLTQSVPPKYLSIKGE